jgi:hypothetical protein
MNDAKWERWAAATGIAFVVFLVASAFIVPAAPPKAGDSIAKITSYYAKHRKALLTAGYLGGIATLFFLWFLGSLRSFLRAAEGGTGRLSAVVFGAGLVTTAVALGSGAAANAITLKVLGTPGSDAVVRALFDLSSLAILFLWFPVAALAAATGTVAWRSGALPKWYAQVTLLFAIVFFMGGSGVYLDSGPLATGGVLAFIVFIVFALWVLLTSILLVQRVGKVAASGPMAPQM